MRQIICKDTGEVVNTYKEYLKTKHWWKIKIKRRMENRPRHCELCSINKRLYLHHKTYKNIGDEQHEDLILICDRCHKNIHGLDNRSIKQKEKWSRDNIQRRFKLPRRLSLSLFRYFVKQKKSWNKESTCQQKYDAYHNYCKNFVRLRMQLGKNKGQVFNFIVESFKDTIDK